MKSKNLKLFLVHPPQGKSHELHTPLMPPGLCLLCSIVCLADPAVSTQRSTFLFNTCIVFCQGTAPKFKSLTLLVPLLMGMQPAHSSLLLPITFHYASLVCFKNISLETIPKGLNQRIHTVHILIDIFKVPSPKGRTNLHALTNTSYAQYAQYCAILTI